MPRQEYPFFGYAYDDHLSYQDHLRLRDSMKAAGAQASGALGKTVSKSSQRAADQIAAGFSEVSSELRQVSSDLRQIDSTLEWGFSSMLDVLDDMNSSLQDLKRIASSPAQTAAYEHFDIARKNHRDGLYPECLQRLEYAINGDSHSQGFREEWRFHQLQGDIYLQFPDRSFVDLPKAESSFLLAARYARATHSRDAALALVAAAVAAYNQGRMLEAQDHADRACGLAPHVAETFFQAARIKLYLEQADRACSLLQRAIELDIDYAQKIPQDAECLRHAKAISDFWKSLGSDAKRRTKEAISAANTALQPIKSWQESKVHATRHAEAFKVMQRHVCFRAENEQCRKLYGLVESQIAAAISQVTTATAGAQKKTVYDYLVAEHVAKSATRLVDDAQDAAQQIEGLFVRVSQSFRDKQQRQYTYWGIGSGIGLMVGMFPLGLCSGLLEAEGGLAALPCFLTWLLLATGMGFGAGWILSQSLWSE